MTLTVNSPLWRLGQISLAVTLGLCSADLASANASASKLKPVKSQKIKPATDGLAEARLIEVLRSIADANNREALGKAEKLVSDYPNFQLAQLVYADLLSSMVRPVQEVGDVPAGIAQAGMENLQALRRESQLRIAALRERPPVDAIPSQFIALSKRNKHAIAVDTAKARLYLFENSDAGPKLLADYYISVGKAGVGKQVEGDQRTPLGVYFVTSNLDPKSLKDLYGSGALPVNYPNVLDIRRGKTGGGIWLHGTPTKQFSRAPQATDGCVAVANPDLDRIIRTVEIRTTPVLIGTNLKWVRPSSLAGERQAFSNTLQAWVRSKQSGNGAEVLKFYANDFSAEGKDLNQFGLVLRTSLAGAGGRAMQIDDLSLIRWTDEAEVMVATFSELVQGEKSGRTLRQYWQLRNSTWKIVYEGAIS